VRVLLCVVGDVRGVTQLHDVVYIVCAGSPTILRFNATTHQRLTDIVVIYLKMPSDIVACERTSQLYVADSGKHVWRVSSDGEDIPRWLSRSPSDTFNPWTLSVTSTRLLVTTFDSHQMIQFDSSDGDELKRLQLLNVDMLPHRAVASSTGAFIVSRYSRQLNQVMSLKSTLAVKCCVRSVVHVYYYLAGLHTSPLTLVVTYF